MSVIDAHQHFWDLDRVTYSWLTPESGSIHRTFEPPELEPQLAAAGVDATVLVQAANSFEDTDAMLERAARFPFIRAVVGWVPLLRPDEAADAAARLVRDPVFVGVRHLIHDEPDPDWVVRDEVIDGLRVLVEHDLSFDVVALTRHLVHVPALAERVPGLRMVIDHLAKPPIREQGWEPWASLLARAAECPGVHAKISGLGTAADPDDWSAEDLRPYVEHAIEVFGTDRLMYGSDWPVSTLAGDYARIWAETNEALAGLSAEERAAVFGGNAQRFYRIPS